MDIYLTKIAEDLHEIRVVRRDGSSESHPLDSRSFLRHDFAHLAVELEVPIRLGYWGSVAAGASLSGTDLAGGDMALAESLAGPVQTLMRKEAGAEQYLSMLVRNLPDLASAELAARIRERARQLTGHWRATPYGREMQIRWPDWDEENSR